MKPADPNATEAAPPASGPAQGSGSQAGSVVAQCKECVSLLGDYVEGTLPKERAEALELHLSRCPPCITFVRTYKKTRSLCRIALAREMPAELVSSLKDFLARKGVPGFSGCAKGADGKSACGDAPAVEVKKA